MLSKLIKQDFKATSRLFLPIIIGFISMAIINKISFELGIVGSTNNRMIETLSVVLMILYALSALIFGIISQVFIAIHFFKNMTGEEGYLSHTLPVKTSALINSKLLVSIFWSFITSIIIILSIILLVSGHVTMDDIRVGIQYMNEALTEVDLSLGIFIFELIVMIIIGYFYSSLMYYVSIAIGHLYHKHRLGASIVAFFVLYFIIQILSTFVGILFGTNQLYTNIHSFGYMYHRLLISSSILSISIAIIFYVVTNYIFTKKLNLE